VRQSLATCARSAPRVPDLRLTWGQLKLIAEGLGLTDDDPEHAAAMILAAIDARQIVAAEYERIVLGLDDGDD
jgi:hypothetical protein